MKTETLIVGAGPAGLAVAACLKQAGRDSVVLERSDRVASSWHAHYDRLHLHTARQLSALRGLAMPGGYPRYPSRDEVIAYLDNYARTFGIEPRFGTEAMGVARHSSWTVTTSDQTFEAENLVLATGIADRPRRVDWPDAETFKGTRLHSSRYRNPAPFTGQRVLVVGFGNSGGEIALDLVGAGVETQLSVRGPVNVAERDILGLPAQRWTIMLSHLPSRFADALTAPIRKAGQRGLAERGLRLSSKGPITQIVEDGRIPLIDVGTLEAIRDGRLPVRPQITRFTATGAIFADDIETSFDTVIEATGYTSQLPQLLGRDVTFLGPDGRPCDHATQCRDQSLYFCGYFVSAGGQLRQIAKDARRIASSICGSGHGPQG